MSSREIYSDCLGFKLFSFFGKSCPGHARRIALIRKIRIRKVCGTYNAIIKAHNWLHASHEEITFHSGFYGKWKSWRKSQETQGTRGIIIMCYVLDEENDLFSPSVFSLYLCLKLKPLYKELLYTIIHKLGNPSSGDVFTDSQLHEYIKEVNSSALHLHHHHNQRSC